MTREEILRIAKPILFNTDMVRAILDGRKTVTRRKVEFVNRKNPNWTGYVRNGLMLYNGMNEPCINPPRYKVGDYLYVRETFSPVFVKPKRYIYATDACVGIGEGADLPIRWHPSIHMPKEAARIFLRVTDVSVERLQDITIDGITNEGLLSMGVHAGDEGIAFAEWKLLWDSTIPKKDLDKYGWNANPWVWVIEFERLEVR